jgi:F0F1-type ATP synthase assembly protein I
MTYIILSLVFLLLGFIAGVLVKRHNIDKVTRVLTEAQMLKEKGKALLDSFKSK